MYSKPLPRVIAGAVVAMIAVAAVLTFTRGEAPATDTASATLPGVTSGTDPVVERSTPTSKTPASADATESEAAETPATTPATSRPTTSPTTTAPKPDPTDPPDPKPTPSPTRPAPCSLVGALLGTCD